jgi:eukaryotic-like serine/threonine-protein kinase
VRTLAEAIEYAHGKRVAHRDLKPANVVLTADEVPKVTDFGLARRLDDPGRRTQSEGIIGTPPYMAPEQAEGRAGAVGPASDVYALGAVLYELLTGRPPFQGRTVVETLRQVSERHPVRPRRLVRGVPRALESVCLKCLEKAPRRRYRSAQELADDLGRWLDGERPRAHRLPARLGRFVRRHRVLSTAAALLVLAAVMAPLIAYLTHPDRPRERIERRLANGGEVTLIGEKGRPAWCSWVTNAATQKDLLAPDGSFTIECWELGLLELVRDPQHTRYRFSAEVRHDRSAGDTGDVGIYFGYSRHTTPRGVEHCFCSVTLNGLLDARRIGPGLKGNDVSLEVRRRSEPSGVYKLFPASPPVVVPVSEKDKGVWRKIAVEVSPEKVRFTVWGDVQSPGESQSQEAARHRLAEARDGVCLPAKPAGVRPGFAPPPEVDPALAPRSPLGLHVYGGSASFRHVVVTPLPNPD